LIRSGSPRIEVTAPRGRRPRGGITVHRSRLIHPDDRAVVDCIPVTSVARTLVDLADVLSEPRLADALKEAEVLRLFDLTALEATLGRLPGRRGRHRLGRVLAEYSPEPRFTRTQIERRFLRLCAKHDLPLPDVNLWIAGHEVDFYWPGDRDRRRRDPPDAPRVPRGSPPRPQARGARHPGQPRQRRDLLDDAALGSELRQIRAERLRDRRAAQ
jgi:hypothetical protein